VPRKKRVPKPAILAPAENNYQRALRLSKRSYERCSKFDSVWVYGNPLTSPLRSDADPNSSDLLEIVTRNQFYVTYRAWFQELKRTQLSKIQLADLLVEVQQAQRSNLPVTEHLANVHQVALVTIRKWLYFLNIELLLEGEQVEDEGAVDPEYMESVESETVKRICAGAGIPAGWHDKHFETEHGERVGHAGCFGRCHNRNGLCRHCFDYFGTDKSIYPQWLLFLMDKNRADVRHAIANKEPVALG